MTLQVSRAPRRLGVARSPRLGGAVQEDMVISAYGVRRSTFRALEGIGGVGLEDRFSAPREIAELATVPRSLSGA